MWITWNYQDTDLSWPLTFEQKVDLFYQRALGWQLHIADMVANGGTAFGEEGRREGKVVSPIRHSGFAVLQICLSYFETIGHYTGKHSGSEDAFCKGLHAVFPDLAKAEPALAKEFAKSFYKDARCGLYHNTQTARVALGQPSGGAAIAYDLKHRRVIVSPERLPRMLKDHVERFRHALLEQQNKRLRAAFEAEFDRDSGTV